MKYLVWDPLNGEREGAREYEGFCPESAATEYARLDSDGNADGLYVDERYNPISAHRGQPIHVEDADGVVTKMRVAITEYDPIYRAVIETDPP